MRLADPASAAPVRAPRTAMTCATIDTAVSAGVRAFYLSTLDVILKSGGPDYLPFLLIGLTLWQWMRSCITHGGYAIWSNLGMVRQVRLPPLVFPLIAMLSDTVKFLFMFALLLVVLWCSRLSAEHGPTSRCRCCSRPCFCLQPARASSSPR